MYRDTIDVSKKGLLREDNVKSGAVMIVGSEEADDAYVRDRRRIASEGLIIAVINLRDEEEVNNVELIEKGTQLPDKLLDELKDAVMYRIAGGDFYGLEKDEVEQLVRKTMTRIFYSRIKRCPLIVPIVFK